MYKIQVLDENSEFITLKSDPLTEEEAWEWSEIITKRTGEFVTIVPVEWI